MRASVLLLSWILGACAPTTDPDDRGAALHMVIDHRPPDVDMANVSLFRPVDDRTATDNVATLLRSIDCTSACYVGIVGSDDATTLAVLRTLCETREDGRKNRGPPTRVDAFLTRTALAEGDGITRTCAFANRASGFELGVALRTDLD